MSRGVVAIPGSGGVVIAGDLDLEIKEMIIRDRKHAENNP